MSHVLAMDPKAKMTWVPKVDRDLPVADQFKIFYNPLDIHRAAEISDGQMISMSKGRKQEYKFATSKMDVKRLEEMIKGWEGLKYPKGHEYEDKVAPYSLENITLIPEGIRREFLDDITGRDNIEGEDDLGEAQTA